MHPAAALLPGLLLLLAPAAAAPRVFPEPREAHWGQGAFKVDAKTVVAGSGSLARLIMSEFSDRHGVAVRLAPTAVPRRNVIVAGTFTDPVVRRFCLARGLQVSATRPGHEGYVLDVSPEAIVIAGSDEAGAFYGVQTLRQLLGNAVPAVRIRDWPVKPFRGVKLFMPGRDHIGFFHRFVRDFMAYYKYNTLIMETNAAMRLDRHPELNAGWLDLAPDLHYTHRRFPAGPNGAAQDSVHHDTADGGVLEKSEVQDLVRWARSQHVEVIPEIPTLSHSYYLLTRHRELAEIPDAEWPDTYCPYHPDTYRLVFDVLDEYIDVMKPKMLHLGHDEWWIPWGVCPRCKNKQPGEVFAYDIKRLHDHLSARKIRMVIWGDHLLESVRGKGLKDPWWKKAGQDVKVAGALSPEQVRQLIPKDILIFNWFWDYPSAEAGEENDQALSNWGFEQVYGNFTPAIPNYARRSARKGVAGGAPSAWIASTEFNFGKDLLRDFIGCAGLLWSGSAEGLDATIDAHLPVIRRWLSGTVPPSQGVDPVTPVSLENVYNDSLPSLRQGRVEAGKQVFELRGGRVLAAGYGGPSRESGAISIGEDATSLIFLHAAARQATNHQAHRMMFNYADSAGLLAWYEVVYQDGLIETIPIRYHVNILEWNRARGYAYFADPVSCGASAEKPVTFYAFEWTNPRLGKVIREVRLKGAAGWRDFQGKAMPDNAVLLAALSVVKKRGIPEPVRAGSYGQR